MDKELETMELEDGELDEVVGGVSMYATNQNAGMNRASGGLYGAHQNYSDMNMSGQTRGATAFAGQNKAGNQFGAKQNADARFGAKQNSGARFGNHRVKGVANAKTRKFK